MKIETHLSLNENFSEEILRKKNNQFKTYSLLTLIFGIVLSVVTIFFVINFQIEPDNLVTIYLFLGDLVIFVIFIVFLERILSLKEESILIKHLGKDAEPPIYENKSGEKKKRRKDKEELKGKSRIEAFFNTIFGCLEPFFDRMFRILEPFFKKIYDKKKMIRYKEQLKGKTWIISFFNKINRVLEVSLKKILRSLEASLNKIFRVLEGFPYIKNKKGKKKFILQIVGWITIVLLFSISVIFRQAFVEFAACGCLRNTIRQWTIYFGFYLFVLSMGALILFFTTKHDPYRVFKLSTFGVIIMTQIPATVDYFFMPTALPYSYIKWKDFFIAFKSLFLHPNLNYAVGIGHSVMIISLIVLFSLYVVIKRIGFASHYKSKLKILFIATRTLLSAFLIYFLIVLTAITPTLIIVLLEQYVGSPLPVAMTPVVLFIVFNIYFLPLFLFLALEILHEEKRKKAERLGIFQTNMLSLARRENKSSQGIFQKSDELKSKFKLKLGILIMALIIFIACEIIIAWILPDTILWS